jgi:hypothetical protein
MTEPVQLRYHQKTLDLLRKRPVISQVNLRLIKAWERKHKLRLPEALREWYSLEGSEIPGTIAWYGSNETIIRTTFSRMAELQSRGLLDPSTEFFVWDPDEYHEYSPVVQYDGTEDPPVVAQVGDVERDDFVKKGLRFSDFIFRQVWELVIFLAADHNEFALLANDCEVGPPELDFLLENAAECFRERRVRGRRLAKNPFTGEIVKLFPYRFAFRHSCGWLSVQCQTNPVRRPADGRWVLLGNSEEGLMTLAKLFWACGDFSRTLTAENESANAILKRLRRQFRRTTKS